MAVALETPAAAGADVPEPVRCACPADCGAPVLVVVLRGTLVIAEPYEWEPRAACQSCLWTRRRVGRPVDCARCDGSGYVGERRPPGTVLAVDVAWSDEGHVRLMGPRTARRRGEALYRLHRCG